jgi:hypothetical protein
MEKKYPGKLKRNIKTRNCPNILRAMVALVLLLSSACSEPIKIRRPQTNRKPQTKVTHTSNRFKLNGFSHLHPSGRRWHVVINTPARLMLAKRSLHTHKGKHTVIFVSSIKKRGRYSSILRKFRQQLRDDFLVTEKQERFSNVKVKSTIVKLDGAYCVISSVTSTDTGVPGAKGKRYTLFANQVVCYHPYKPKFLVKLAYTERVPPGIEPAEEPGSIIKTMAKSLRFNEVSIKNPFRKTSTPKTNKIPKVLVEFVIGSHVTEDVQNANESGAGKMFGIGYHKIFQNRITVGGTLSYGFLNATDGPDGDSWEKSMFLATGEARIYFVSPRWFGLGLGLLFVTGEIGVAGISTDMKTSPITSDNSGTVGRAMLGIGVGINLFYLPVDITPVFCGIRVKLRSYLGDSTSFSTTITEFQCGFRY